MYRLVIVLYVPVLHQLTGSNCHTVLASNLSNRFYRKHCRLSYSMYCTNTCTRCTRK